MDEVHYTDQAYIDLATLMGRKIAKDRGADIDGATGPSIGSATRFGNTITVSILHDGGTGLNLTSDIEGFRFFDDGVETTISSVTSDGISEVSINLANTPTGVETLYYIFDDEYPLDKTKILSDNAAVPVPLQSGSISVLPF